MSENIISCPSCDCEQVVKNGFIHNGKQNFLCKSCSRQFVLNPKNKVIEQETRDLIDKLLLEKLPLAGIALSYWCIRKMVADICKYVVYIYPKERRSLAQKKGQLTIQCDEMWSFVANRKNKQWKELALDTETHEIVGVYVGERSRNGAEGLWQSLPPLYRQCAICYTDF